MILAHRHRRRAMHGDAARQHRRHHGTAAHRGSASGALRDRPGCVVAERGMISSATIAALEERGLEYISAPASAATGACARSCSRTRSPSHRSRSSAPAARPSSSSRRSWWVAPAMSSRNEAQADKDRADRHAIVDGLGRQLQKGDKALIGNAGYRRYLRRSGPGAAFESIPASWPKRHDTTASSCCGPTPASPRQRRAALPRPARGRDPAHRQGHLRHPAHLPGHPRIFCSFLALVPAKELQDRSSSVPNGTGSCANRRLQIGVIEKDHPHRRAHPRHRCHPAFRAVGVALPPNIAETQAL